MRIELPIFRQIDLDGALPPRAFQVWRAAIEQLDVVDYRPLKFAIVETQLQLDRSTVFRAMTTLIDQGYLMRRDGKYRVPLSRFEEPPEGESLEEERGKSVQNRRMRPRVHSPGVF